MGEHREKVLMRMFSMVAQPCEKENCACPRPHVRMTSTKRQMLKATDAPTDLFAPTTELAELFPSQGLSPNLWTSASSDRRRRKRTCAAGGSGKLALCGEESLFGDIWPPRPPTFCDVCCIA